MMRRLLCGRTGSRLEILHPARPGSRTGAFLEPLAEWLGCGLQSRLHRFESGRALSERYGDLKTSYRSSTPVVQGTERLPPKEDVAGSNPAGGTI